MNRKNGIIAGGTGSGKATLMKAILTMFPSPTGSLSSSRLQSFGCYG